MGLTPQEQQELAQLEQSNTQDNLTEDKQLTDNTPKDIQTSNITSDELKELMALESSRNNDVGESAPRNINRYILGVPFELNVPIPFSGGKVLPITTQREDTTGKIPFFDAIQGAESPEDMVKYGINPVVRGLGTTLEATKGMSQDILASAAAYANQRLANIPRAVFNASTNGEIAYPEAKTSIGRAISDVSGIAGGLQFGTGILGTTVGRDLGGKLLIKEAEDFAKQRLTEKMVKGGIMSAMYADTNTGYGTTPSDIVDRTIGKFTGGAALMGLGSVAGEAVGKLVGNTIKFIRRGGAQISDIDNQFIKERGISNVVTKERADPRYLVDKVVPEARTTIVDNIVNGTKLRQTLQSMGFNPDQIETVANIPTKVRAMFKDNILKDWDNFQTALQSKIDETGATLGKLQKDASEINSRFKINKTVNIAKQELKDMGLLDINGNPIEKNVTNASSAGKKIFSFYQDAINQTQSKYKISYNAAIEQTQANFYHDMLDDAYRLASGREIKAITVIKKSLNKEIAKHIDSTLGLSSTNSYAKTSQLYSQLKNFDDIGTKLMKVTNPEFLYTRLDSGIRGKNLAREDALSNLLGKKLTDDAYSWKLTQDLLNNTRNIATKHGLIETGLKGATKMGYGAAETADNIGKVMGNIASTAKDINTRTGERLSSVAKELSTPVVSSVATGLGTSLTGSKEVNADVLKDKRQLAEAFLKTEGNLQPGQTPFRIDPNNKFNNTLLGVKIDSTAKKTDNTKNFYYVKPGTDIANMIEKQLSLYADRHPEWTVKKAINEFDRTNPAGKVRELKRIGIDVNGKLSDFFPTQRKGKK